MQYNPFTRKCLDCGFERIPDQKNVKQGKAKFVIYTCTMCKRQDIERWADRPRPKVWNGRGFVEPDFESDEDADH